MNNFGFVYSKEQAFDFLDDFAINRKQEIDERQLSPDTGLIKSYMLETQLDHSDLSSKAFYGWELKQVDDGFFIVRTQQEDIGFLETVSSRHIAIHTTRGADFTDNALQRVVRYSPHLDFVWLSSFYLNLIWETLIKEQRKRRYVKFKFEYIDLFEHEYLDDEEQDDDNSDAPEDEETNDELKKERRESNLTIGMSAYKLAEVIPQLQGTLPDFNVIKMLRIPASETIRGGYEFWDWGKITHRSKSFRDGHTNLYGMVQLYQDVTEIIEKLVWFSAETTRLDNSHESITLRGTPVTFVFGRPLALNTFHNFIEKVFEKGQTNFRLWGNPIFFGENKVHIYGLDMHLGQKIYMELTPSRFIIVLPKNTCGNTVHRLASNIQSYLSPDVQLYIGERLYQDIILDVLLGRVTNDR